MTKIECVLIAWVLIFIAGVIVGNLLSYYYHSRKYRKRAEIEIAQVRREYTRKLDDANRKTMANLFEEVLQ